MIITDNIILSIQRHFPDLYINNDRSKILGELSFFAYYDGKWLHLNPLKQRKSDVFHSYYEIEIWLNKLDVYALPMVFETSGKIIKYANDNNVPPVDLHLNMDGSCCLGIFTPKEAANMSLDKFIIEVVFSFFAWQAYFSKYKKKPPWGEYSHKHGFMEKRHDILFDMNKAGRNELCPCGSGKKFKLCCLNQFNDFKRSIQ